MFGSAVDTEVLKGVLLVTGVSLVVLFVVFLLLREFNCWYWKVNERMTILREIRDLLDRALVRDEAQKEALAANARREKHTECRQCHARFAGDLTGQFCEQCGARL